MQHYQEALNNARKHPKHQEPTKTTSTWKIEANQMQFPEPHHKCQHLQQLFCNSRGENRGITNEFDVQARPKENTSTDQEKVLVAESPRQTSGRCNISYIETQEH